METLIYDKLDNHAVKCHVCNHFCIIQDGKRGRCRVRENSGGKLTTLVYPKVIAKSVDPIEKKPLFHVKPGSYSYSIATAGCNFQCSFCQNARIAQVPENYPGCRLKGEDMLPETIIKEAVKRGCETVSYTYTEPTVFCELAMETAKLAREEGLLNIFVTNGYMSPRLLEMAAPLLEAANVDLKAFNDTFYKRYCRARLDPVKETIKKMKTAGIVVEITTLLIPGLNDDPSEIDAMARFIASDVGKETPWHISRFHPCHKMRDKPPTSLSSLERVYTAGKAAGLDYVYVGNVPGQTLENTYCHSCGELLIERCAYRIENHLKEKSKCPACHSIVYGIY